MDTFATMQKVKATPDNRKPAATFTEVAQSVYFIYYSTCEAIVIVSQPARTDLVVDSYLPVSIKNSQQERRTKVSAKRYVITS